MSIVLFRLELQLNKNLLYSLVEAGVKYISIVLFRLELQLNKFLLYCLGWSWSKRKVYCIIQVGAGASFLNVMANGGAGDVDIYLKYEEYPT